MSNLIAVVATAVIVNGERIVIAAGHPLPELSEHDSEALVRTGAASDPELDKRAGREAAKTQRAAEAEFEATRERVQAEAASTAAPPAQALQKPPASPAGKSAKAR